jgi:hypothetical protein
LLALLAIPLRHAIADPTFLPNTDMMDASYRHFYLPKPWPRLCQEACLIDAACHVWTFLREVLSDRLRFATLKPGLRHRARMLAAPQEQSELGCRGGRIGSRPRSPGAI